MPIFPNSAVRATFIGYGVPAAAVQLDARTYQGIDPAQFPALRDAFRAWETGIVVNGKSKGDYEVGAQGQDINVCYDIAEDFRYWMRRDYWETVVALGATALFGDNIAFGTLRGPAPAASGITTDHCWCWYIDTAGQLHFIEPQKTTVTPWEYPLAYDFTQITGVSG